VIRHFLLLVAKDLRLEWRSRALLGGQVVWTLLTVLLLVFALTSGAPPKSLAGLLWISILFPAYHGMARSFQAEVDSGCLDVLVAAPVSRPVIYLARAAVNAILLAVSAAIAVPAFFAAFNVALAVPWWEFTGTVLLGLIGFAAVGTAMAALSARTRLSAQALPLLIFPVSVPLLLGLVVETGLELGGGAQGPWLTLIVLFDAIFLAVPALLFDIVLEV
jgi:ABC-type transport system involved in cytochrome c biogenesis permease component